MYYVLGISYDGYVDFVAEYKTKELRDRQVGIGGYSNFLPLDDEMIARHYYSLSKDYKDTGKSFDDRTIR
jgi:hypothetical protein